MKTIGIVGSRRRGSYPYYLKVYEAFSKVYEYGDEIVSGGCPKGGDAFAEVIARDLQIPIKIYYAEWDKLGRCAGFQRNGKIARDANVLIACVAPDRTGGTEDTIKKFLQIRPKGKLILV
jgi:hypothetical protein